MPVPRCFVSTFGQPLTPLSTITHSKGWFTYKVMQR